VSLLSTNFSDGSEIDPQTVTKLPLHGPKPAATVVRVVTVLWRRRANRKWTAGRRWMKNWTSSSRQKVISMSDIALLHPLS